LRLISLNSIYLYLMAANLLIFLQNKNAGGENPTKV